jgi:hypothetical protein
VTSGPAQRFHSSVYIPSSGAPPPPTPAHEPSGTRQQNPDSQTKLKSAPTSRRCGAATTSRRLRSRNRGRSRHPLGSRSRSSNPQRVRGPAQPRRRRSRAPIARIPRLTELRRPNSPPIRRSQLPASASPQIFYCSARVEREEERRERFKSATSLRSLAGWWWWEYCSSSSSLLRSLSRARALSE